MKNLKPIKVKIFYDENLRKITGKDFEEATVSENLDFMMFLGFIFSSYADISKKFMPGTLGFLLNGKRPEESTPLKDGDALEIKGLTIKEVRRNIEDAVSAVIKYYAINITFEKIKDRVFNETNSKDINALSEVFIGSLSNIDEINRVLQLFNMVWNYFPHKNLNGLSPAEKLLEYREGQE